MKNTWKLDELAEKSQQYLQLEGESNRVRWKPNGRQIRYYTTLGLLDKPFGGRGQGASYGPKHLLQLVAIKRLQHQGLKLAKIQPILNGLSSEKLTELLGFSQEWLAELERELQDKDEAEDRADSEFWAVIPDIPQQKTTIARYHHFELAPGATFVASQTALEHLDEEQQQKLASELQSVWQRYRS